MRYRIVLFFLVICCAGSITAARAESIYVSDVREISQREGPSTEYRIVRMLAAGEELETLESRNGWLKVRNAYGDEGWVLKRYTSSRIPVSHELRNVQEKYDQLHAASKGALDRVADLEEENQNLLAALSEATNKLVDLKEEHDKLQEDAANVIALRQEHDKLWEEHGQLVAEAKILRKENQKFTSNDRFYWFLTGGVVFLVAWAIGVVTGRLQGKRRNTLQYT
jgi:SH3 domain protein